MFYLKKQKIKGGRPYGKRYHKMSKKANGKIREIRDEQVVLELPHKRRNVWDHLPPWSLDYGK